ncbi:MAG: hypothetical protein QXF15_01970 [Candidatus Aenigmatarchaeota archaeon]|nr:hypothetical protein [Candidatus Aenigmarchaeota archaeon]
MEVQQFEEKFKEKMFEIEKKFLLLETRIEKLEGKESVIESKIPKESISEEDFKKVEHRLDSIYIELSKKIEMLESLIKELSLEELKENIKEIRKLKEEIAILKQEKGLDKEKIENIVSLLSDRQNTFISNVQASLIEFQERIKNLNNILEGLNEFSNRTANIATDAYEKTQDIKNKIAEIENKLQLLQKYIIALKVSEPFILE